MFLSKFSFYCTHCCLKSNEKHIRALYNSFLRSVQGINTREWLSQLARTAYTLAVSLSFPSGFTLVFLSSFPSSSGGNLFPLLSSPKGFPSASDYLWLQLVSRQPCGPVWRLCSLFSPQTAVREGWRGGERRT